MSKTICWPSEFLEEVMMEPSGTTRFAIRPGALYYNTQYFQKGEMVDIRIESQVVRKALIVDDLKVLTIKDLKQMHYNLLKSQINTKQKLIEFLSVRYRANITEDTQITLIAYVNMNLIHLKEN